MTEKLINFEKVIYAGPKVFEVQRIKHFILKLALQKQDLTSVPDTFHPDHVCNICSRVCLSKAGLDSQMKSHDSKQSQAYLTVALPQQPTGNSCQFFDKVCTSEKPYEREQS